MQTKNTDSFKQRRPQSWTSCFTLLLGLPLLLLLLYYGYCWGWWGQHSLLLQYFFQCSCPLASKEARYPDEVDVIVPACHYGNSMLSPSGRLLYVHENNGKFNSTYLLDLQTNQKITFTLPEGSNYFLTDDLIFLSLDYGGGEYILDRSTEKQYPIQSFINLQPKAYSYGKLDADLLFEALLQVETVFLIDAPYQPVIALSSDFRSHPERSFTFDASALSGNGTNLLEQFLQQNNIIYYHIPATFPHEAVSRNRSLIARDDGIYLVETNQVIIKAPPSLIRGWTSDDRSVIYSSGGLCLIRRGLPFSDDVGCAIRVSQPVLKLKVPEIYLSPNGIQ
jgi:hypothetical protein